MAVPPGVTSSCPRTTTTSSSINQRDKIRVSWRYCFVRSTSVCGGVGVVLTGAALSCISYTPQYEGGDTTHSRK